MLKKLLKLLGIYSPELVDKKELLNFIEALRPLKTEHRLIRIGGSNDGGYLLPDDLDGIAGVISPGVGELSNFEDYFAHQGIKVVMADKSVAGPAVENDNFKFLPKFIGSKNSRDFITLDKLTLETFGECDDDLLLQMDIEGFEYESLFNLSDELQRRFRIIVLEAHFLDMLHTRHGFAIYARALGKILDTHYCVHIHPNNCSKSVKLQGIEIPPAMEFTFIRKDRCKSLQSIEFLPHALDEDCVDYYPTLKLPKIWY